MAAPEISSERIFSAILASGVKSPSAIELGSELVDSWVEQCWAADQRYRTLGLEVGWFVELDERTFIVGCVDKLAVEREYSGVCHCGASMEGHPVWDNHSATEMIRDSAPFVFEQKTTAASKTWTCDRWFEELRSGSQVKTYALALGCGTFIFKKEPCDVEGGVHHGGCAHGCSGEYWEETFNVSSPRVLARAVTKSKPPQIWPGVDGAWIDFTDDTLEATVNAYRNAAVAIRAQRTTQLLPWQLPSFQCKLKFGFKERLCSAWDVCHSLEPRFPVRDLAVRPLGISPGSDSVVDHLVRTGRIPLDKFGDYVILSGSSLKSWQQCPELWRQESIGATREDDNEAMDTGTVFHSGVAEYGKILKESGY